MPKHEKLMQAYEGKLSKEEGLKIRTENLFRNAFKSKSGQTLADTDVLKELAKNLGYTKEKLLEE